MAAGQTIGKFIPQCYEPSATPPTPSKRGGHPVLLFDDTTNETCYFSDVMPQNYHGGGLTVYVHVAMGTATSGNVDIDVAFERLGETQDMDSDSFASVQSADDNTVPGTAGQLMIVEVTFTSGQIDSIAAGEGYRISITRDATNDTASGNMQLRFVEIRES